MRIVVLLFGVLTVIGSSGSAVAAAKPTAGLNNVGAAWSPDSARIAFVSEGAGPNDHDLWVMDADGSRARNLTPDGLNEGAPVWSPDGRQLAFTSAPVAGTISPAVEVIDYGGAGRRALARGSSPSWSSDGRRLAYLGADGLRTIGVDGSGDHLVVPTTSSFRGATAWSPRGDEIAYLDGNDLWIVDADGSGPHRLSDFGTPAMRHAVAPIWAPDGSAVAFIAGGAFGVPGPHEVWIVEPAGQGLTRVASFAVIDSGPSWMPDSRSIVFTAAKDREEGNFDVYRVALDGSNPVDISNDRVWNEDSTVTPDGKKIAFTVRYGTGFESSDIWTLDLRTRVRRNLTGTASGLTVDARTLRAPNKLVVHRVTAGVDRSFGPLPILRIGVHVQDSRVDDVRNAIVTVKLPLRSLIAMRPVRRTDVHGATEVDFRARTPHRLPSGMRLTLVVHAHPPGSYSRSIVATKRVVVRLKPFS